MTRRLVAILAVTVVGLWLSWAHDQSARVIAPPPAAPPIAADPGTALLAPPGGSGGDGYGTSLAYAPDGRTLAVTRMEVVDQAGGKFASAALISLRDMPGGGERAVIREEGAFAAECPAAFGPDGRILAVVLGRAIKLYDVATGATAARLDFPGALESSSLAFAPDGRTLAATNELGQLITWDVATRRQAPPVQLSTRSAEGVAVSPDGRTIAVAATGPAVCRPVFGLFGLLPTGVACGTGPSRVRLFDRAALAPRGELVHGSRLRSVAFAPDGKSLASGGGTATLWDLGTHAGQIVVARHNDVDVRCVAFAPDGRTLAVGLRRADAGRTTRGEVDLCDVPGGTPRVALRGDLRSVDALAFAPDGRSLVAADSGRVVRWELPPAAVH